MWWVASKCDCLIASPTNHTHNHKLSPQLHWTSYSLSLPPLSLQWIPKYFPVGFTLLPAWEDHHQHLIIEALIMMLQDQMKTQHRILSTWAIYQRLCFHLWVSQDVNRRMSNLQLGSSPASTQNTGDLFSFFFGGGGGSASYIHKHASITMY